MSSKTRLIDSNGEHVISQYSSHYSQTDCFEAWFFVSAARIPDEPSNLRHSFVIRSSNITASLRWSPAEPSSVVTGYRVVWGHVFHRHGHIMDKNNALTKVLSKVCDCADLHSFSMTRCVGWPLNSSLGYFFETSLSWLVSGKTRQLAVSGVNHIRQHCQLMWPQLFSHQKQCFQDFPCGPALPNPFANCCFFFSVFQTHFPVAPCKPHVPVP